jgi:hypothetical protein
VAEPLESIGALSVLLQDLQPGQGGRAREELQRMNDECLVLLECDVVIFPINYLKRDRLLFNGVESGQYRGPVYRREFRDVCRIR